MFVYMKVHKWEDVGLEQVGNYRLPIPVSLKVPGDGSIGFLDVYDTKENAVKAGCGSQYLVEVKESE